MEKFKLFHPSKEHEKAALYYRLEYLENRKP